METVKTGLINVSPDNPESRYKGAGFDELVASVKEKGVLMPILIRPVPKKKAGGAQYEAVAGNRRLMAAQSVGLKEIPVRVVEMTDEEAGEARIIENLQRADMHPMDEAAAFKVLMTQKKDVVEIAAKIGKSEKFVRERLLLANLEASVEKAAREEKLPIAHAVVIGRLPKGEQAKALKFATRHSRICSLPDLKEHIAENIYRQAMKSPPWKNDDIAKAEIAKAIGANGDAKTLFGEDAVETFDDPKQYGLAVAAWITLKRGEYEAAGKPLLLLSDEYQSTTKGVLGRKEYDTGPGYGKAKTCKSFEDGIVIEGRKIGSMLKVCRDKSCGKHNYITEPKTPEAKADAREKRKKEIEKEKAKRDADTKAIAAAVAKVKFPLPEKQLDAILSLAIRRASHDVHQGIVRRRALEVIVKKASYGGTHKDYEGTIVAAAKSMPAKDKAGLLFECLVPGYSPHYSDGRTAAIKKI